MAQIHVRNISGKGNAGKYMDRSPKIYAAGVRSLQPEIRVADCMKDCMVQDTAKNIKTKSNQLSKFKSVRLSKEKDMRNSGPFNESSELINPVVKTKFQTLVEDLKSTVYTSYWKKEVGKVPDLASCLPPNLNIQNITFGKKTIHPDDLYHVIMPNCLVPVELSQSPGYQLNRNYCKYSYNSNDTYGIKTTADKNGNYVKCCLTDDRIYIGTSLRKPIITAQRNFQNKKQAELGICLAPNENINCVPEGHIFGKVEPKDNIVGCFTNCELNPKRELFKKCLAHLNTLRKCLSKRLDGSFFHEFYLQLKYLDTSKCGWLSKDIIYHLCTTKYIRFNPSLIEPLLSMWKAIDHLNIEYNTFVNIINFREPLPWLPKVWDIPSECSEFVTTYMDMVTPQQTDDRTDMAGIPSGRYFDKDYPITPNGCCKADRSYLPHESDAKACLCPSIFTLYGISHRDMYMERDPEQVKRVFKAIEENMNEEMFDTIWKDSMKYHPKRLVCYETFRRALMEYKKKESNNKTKLLKTG